MAFLLCAVPNIVTAQDEETHSDWPDIISPDRSNGDLIGIGGIVLKDGQIIEAAFNGQKNVRLDDPIEPDELWHLGSITKPMTATMIARLVEKDILSWDETVADVLGTMKVHDQWHDVSIIDLLSHTSGAPANFSRWTNLFQPKGPEKILAARKKQVRKIIRAKPVTQPGAEYQYSNVGYTIAAHMAEVRTGKSWEQLMREEVFDPLALDSAGFGPPQHEGDCLAAVGHRNGYPADPSGLADNSPIMGPAGTVHMSLQDLVSFGQVHVEGLNGRSTYLSQGTFERLHSPKMKNYALGWMVQEVDFSPELKVSWHNGSNTMWYALLYLLPEQNIVYAMASNSGDIVAGDKLFRQAIESHFNSMEDATE